MLVRLKEDRCFEVMKFSTLEDIPFTVSKDQVLEIDFIDDAAIENAKDDEDLYEFLSSYKGYYWIKTDMFDGSKYCVDDADVFLLLENEFDIIEE